MKELSIEEKAKRYDEAIERAKKEKEESRNLGLLEFIEEIFPELKESEDEKVRKEMIFYFQEEILQCSIQEHADKMKKFIAWLEKNGEQKPAWSGGDEAHLHSLITHLEQWIESNPDTTGADIQGENIAWLKSLRPQNRWKPSDEMLEALYRVIPENVMEISEDEMLLDKLYQGLKYGRVLSKK